MALKQFVVTSSMGKRLIAKGLGQHPSVKDVLSKGTLVIIAGSTNGYVAEEILRATSQDEGFSRNGFRRGVTVPPNYTGGGGARLAGDIIIVDGVWRAKGKTIFDVVDDLKGGDVILKGGNALNISDRQASVYIGDPHCGTAGASLPAVVGRRVKLIVPIGLEKRIVMSIADIAKLTNAPDAAGPRMLPLPGEVFTELDAVTTATGASAVLLGAGGIYGAEGACYIGVDGEDDQLDAAESFIKSAADEPLCEI